MNKAIYSFREKKTVRKMMTLCGKFKKDVWEKERAREDETGERERERESNILLSFIFFF